MLKQTLEAVGLKTVSDIPADEIFSQNFNFEKYGLNESARKRLNVLRDFVAEYNRERPIDKTKPVTNSREAVELLYDTLRGLDHEEVWVLYLNKAGKPILKTRIGEGTLDTAIIDKRKIICTALEKKATGVILYHNHPSGVPEPSACDIRETESLSKALKVFDMSLMDHIIVSDSKYYAFSEEKTIDIRRG